MIGRRLFLQHTAGFSFGLLAGRAGALFAADPAKKPESKNKPLEQVVFDRLLAKHQDMTYDRLLASAYKPRDYVKEISFEPSKAAYFDRIAERLQMTKEEKDIFDKTGFVSIDQKRRHSFGSAYYQIYAADLPVLVTTDSIMHAVHQSYDDILMELEVTLFTWTIGQILEDCHQKLGGMKIDAALNNNGADVDLYLTVARNLLAGAGAPDKDESRFNKDEWNGQLAVAAQRGNDQEALGRLKDIQALKIQVPFQDQPTKIYGGERFFDFSQFKPRGHYSKSIALKRYFRTMMWLGRIDCGWNVLPTDGTPGVKSDSDRELRNSVLLVELLQATDNVKRLKALDDIIAFMVGKSDNLSVFALADLMKENKTSTLADVKDAKDLSRLKDAVKNGKHAQQMIRSQVVISDPNDPYYKVPPPSAFQMFGQRFIIDSFVLSQVVFDSIVFQNRKQLRMMPAGLDAMAALGNAEALPLLGAELRKFNYSANLLACREFVDLHTPEFWKANLYNLWLDCLRTLHEDMNGQANFPEVMKTRTWQMKQLQTQLASWAELRHDTILYAKQSYTAVPLCEYPAGYVEPYPQFYARVKFFATEAVKLFKDADYSCKDKGRADQLKSVKDSQEKFFTKMAETIGTLETLAKKELEAKPFTEDEKTFIKKVIDIRGGGSGRPRYDGWYCELFYNRSNCASWEPTVADVHTDPESRSCLEVAVGDVNFGVIAIDNEKHRAVYVGPLFSYYEFRHPVQDRLTDEQWQQMIAQGKTPPRPDWVKDFQAPAQERPPVLPKRAP